MTRERRRSGGPAVGGRRARTAACAGLAAGLVLLLCGAAAPGFAAPKDTRPPAGALTPSPPARPASPTIPAARATTGMCQCVSDHDRRNIRCLSSVEECQTACAASKYSFVPNAPNCAATAQSR